MNAQAKIEPVPVAEQLAKLREPFPANQISKLPKETRKQIEDRKNRVQGCMVWKCPECGNAHHKDAVHLDYVGHAALTDRLLDTDIEWSWEPMAYAQDGLPLLDRSGGLWIKLTVCGVTRPGYGSADGKQGGDAIKEIIGDALRNAAMRFGAALDLWHKGDLHADEPSEKEAEQAASEGGMPEHEFAKLVQLIEATNADTGAMLKHYGVENLRQLNQQQFGSAVEALKKKLAKMAKDETNDAAKKAAPADEFADLDDEIPY